MLMAPGHAAPAGLAAAAGPRALAEELVPALLHIAAPALRPVSQHLYTRWGRADGRDLLHCYNNHT